MTSKKFYKYVLSKFTPLLFFLLFLPGWISLVIFPERYPGFLPHYTCICIANIFILEIIDSFIRTIFIIHRYKITDKARIRLYLFYIPYLPSLIGCTIYTLCLIITKTPHNRSFILYIYAINSTLMYILSMFLNTKLNIFRFISDESDEEANEERIENK